MFEVPFIIQQQSLKFLAPDGHKASYKIMETQINIYHPFRVTNGTMQLLHPHLPSPVFRVEDSKVPVPSSCSCST